MGTPPRKSGALKDANTTLSGILWMVLSGLSFVMVNGIIRYLGTDLPAVETAFLRYFFGSLLLTPILLRLWKAPPSNRSMLRFATRGVVHAIAVGLWFYAMTRIPLTEVVALGYAVPIFITIGAALFLGEGLHLRRVAGVLIGIVGVLIILRPGISAISTGQLAQLLAAPLFAASFLLAKSMTREFDSNTIVVMLSLFCSLALLPGALYVWHWPTLTEVAWLVLAAVLATVGHYGYTLAISLVPISMVQPVTFLQLVWAALLGIAAFGDPLDPIVFIGSGVIVAAASYISHRETQVAREQITPPSTGTKF